MRTLNNQASAILVLGFITLTGCSMQGDDTGTVDAGPTADYSRLDLEKGPFIVSDYDPSPKYMYAIGIPYSSVNFALTTSTYFVGYGADSSDQSWTATNMYVTEIMHLPQGDVGIVYFNPTASYNTLRAGNMYDANNPRCAEAAYHDMAECWDNLTRYIGVNPLVVADATFTGALISVSTIAGEGLYAAHAVPPAAETTN